MRFAFATVVCAPRGGWSDPPDRDARRRVLDWAAQSGFEGVELSPRWLNVLDFPPAGITELRDDLADRSLEVAGINLSRWMLTRGEDASRRFAQARRAIALAAELGSEVVCLSLSMPTLPATDRPPVTGADISSAEWERAVEMGCELGELADRHGVRLAFELHDDGLLDTPERCLEFVRRIGRPHVGVNPDVANICRGPGPLPDWRAAYRLLAPRVICWHVKNYAGGQPAPLDAGDIDIAWAWGVLRRAGFDGWVSIEGYTGEVFASQVHSLAYLKELQTRVATPALPVGGRS